MKLCKKFEITLLTWTSKLANTPLLLLTWLCPLCSPKKLPCRVTAIQNTYILNNRMIRGNEEINRKDELRYCNDPILKNFRILHTWTSKFANTPVVFRVHRMFIFSLTAAMIFHRKNSHVEYPNYNLIYY